MGYDTIFKLIGDVGFPIAAALLGGVFVYFVINYILVDAVVSSALGLKPDLDRIARADGKNDARKD
jgi:hypothetical protein